MRRQRQLGSILPGIPVLLALIGCASAPSGEPRELFDERTGATLLVVHEPSIFARPRKEVAANERDYVTLVAAARNVMGDVRLSLIAHRWSTVDARVAAPSDATGRALIIVADGRDIRLTPLKALPAALSDGDALLRPPVSQAQTLAYPIDVVTLKYIAESSSLSLSFDVSQDPRPYSLWSDGRQALLLFLAAPAVLHSKPEQ